MSAHKLEVLDTPEAVHARGAELLAQAAKQAVAERGRVELAVSGGSDPWPMFSQLEDLFGDWDKAELFQVDERVAPAGSDERNLTHLIESLSIGAQGSIKPMPVTDDDLDAAAERYAGSLPERLDIAVTAGEYQGVRRMTLTYPEIESIRSLLWVVTGESKVDALKKLLAQDPSTPSGRVRPGGDSLILADRAAAPNA